MFAVVEVLTSCALVIKLLFMCDMLRCNIKSTRRRFNPYL